MRSDGARPKPTLAWACIALVAVALALSQVAGCDDAGGALLESERDAFFGADTGNTGMVPTSDTTMREPEVELVLQNPEPARDFVFVASTALDSVAKIDARSLEIESVAVGDRPTIVRARSTRNTAAVLNLGSADISVIHARTDPAEDDVLVRLDIERHLNQMVMSPSGDHVVVYFDDALRRDEAEGDPEADPVGSFQLIEVARVVEGEEQTVTLPISFRVRGVTFDDASERAFVVTDEFIHVVDLDAVVNDPSSWDPADRVALTDDEIMLPGDDRETLVTSDGAYAMVRGATIDGVIAIDMTTDTHTFVPLAAAPTDLDLLPDGTAALAVVDGDLDVLPLPEVLDDPMAGVHVDVPDDIAIGQALMEPEGTHAILFSTAAEAATLGRYDFASGEAEFHRLGSGKPIAGAVLGPTGNWVYVAHDAEPEHPNAARRLDGFSLVEFDSARNDGRPFDRLVQTDAKVDSVLFTPDAGHLFAIVDEPRDDLRQFVGVELESLTPWTDTVGSPPAILGALPAANRIYVGQEHPTGRISFVDIESHRIQTVTGFELNSRTR